MAPRHPLRGLKELPWAWILGYWVLAYLGHLLGLAFRQSPVVSLFFFPAGLSLTFLLIVGPRYAPLVVLPHLLRGLSVPFPHSWLPSLVLGLFHAHAYGLMAYLLRGPLKIHPRLKTLRDIGVVLVLAGTIPLLSGWGSMAFLASEGVIQPGTLLPYTLQFWLGDLTAILVFAPFLLQWVVPSLQGARRRLPQTVGGMELLELAVQAALLVALPNLWAFLGPERGWAFLHLTFLPFMWIGLRQGLPGVSLALPLGTLLIAIYAPRIPTSLLAHPNDLSYFLVALASTSLLAGAAFSERLRAQRSEQQQALRLRQLLDGTPVTIAVHQGGRFTYVNEAGAKLLGYSAPREIIGTDIDLALHSESRELAHARIHQAETQRGTLGVAEERLCRLDGGIVEVEMHTTGFLEDGKPTVQVVAVDITRRKEAERQLNGLLKEKEFLLREVQHRVKNNLQVMGSLLNLQASHAKEPETRRALQDAQDRLQTLALIHQRLDPAPHPVPVNLSQLLEQLAQRLTRSYALSPGQVDLDLRMAPLDMSTETATRLGMLLNELLSNCFKHAFPQGRRGHVEVRLWQEENEIHLVVGDDGPGLPPSLTLAGATSLGFQILRSLTEQLKGNLELEGGLGCVFHLRFPPPEAP